MNDSQWLAAALGKSYGAEFRALEIIYDCEQRILQKQRRKLEATARWEKEIREANEPRDTR